LLVNNPFLEVCLMTLKNNVDRQVTSRVKINTLTYYCYATSTIFLYSSSVCSVFAMNLNGPAAHHVDCE
jgi:predicted transglutaminase-like protease